MSESVTSLMNLPVPDPGTNRESSHMDTVTGYLNGTYVPRSRKVIRTPKCGRSVIPETSDVGTTFPTVNRSKLTNQSSH
jgi:hypothetical protein